METLAREGREAGRTTRPLDVIDVGLIPYAEAWELQQRLVAEVGAGARGDTLLMLEHPHTYTCGRRGGRDHILISQEQISAEGIAVLDVDRGGDITYHGPGQLVAYPIINVMSDGGTIDYHAYIRSLETVLIQLLEGYGIAAYRVPGYTGVWVMTSAGEEKIAAIGVKVDGRGVTSHGIALNVTTDLRFFSYIVPCGISEKGVASLERLLPDPPSMQQVKRVFAAHFSAVYGFDPRQ